MAIILTLNIMPLKAAQLPNASNLEIIPALSRGIGQVMFQENIFTGIILFVGILVCSQDIGIICASGEQGLGLLSHVCAHFP